MGDNAITLNPAISEAALPIKARLHAPPTATSASLCDWPFSRLSRYRSVTWIQ